MQVFSSLPKAGASGQDSDSRPANITAMMTDPFVFVPITKDEAAKGRGAAKRIVRAHVTRVQHAKSTNQGNHMHLQTWTVKPYIHREPVPIRRKPRTDAAAEKKRTASAKAAATKKSQSPDNSSARSAVVKVPSPLLLVGGAAEDPFWSFPVDYQPTLSPIFAHCKPRRICLL